MTSSREILISAVDYARIEPMIRDAVASRDAPREVLCALRSKIDQARVVPPCDMPADVVTMNSLVQVRDLETEEVDTYALAYPGFSDITRNRLSVLTPVGAALLGRRQGETIEWASPLGPSRMRVEQIEFQPERAGEYTT